METHESLGRNYPREVALKQGSVTFRLMGPSDSDAILRFARKLPQDDLLFLRLDISTPEGVSEWLDNINDGRTVSILAEADGEVVGYASLHHNNVMWNRHLGEIRVNVGDAYRRQGLGRRLVDEAFSLGSSLGLRKITAQMTPDQRGARTTFERLGFRPEALLADFVVDRDGKTRDLLIMSHDLAGFTDMEHIAVGAASARR